MNFADLKPVSYRNNNFINDVSALMILEEITVQLDHKAEKISHMEAILTIGFPGRVIKLHNVDNKTFSDKLRRLVRTLAVARDMLGTPRVKYLPKTTHHRYDVMLEEKHVNSTAALYFTSQYVDDKVDSIMLALSDCSHKVMIFVNKVEIIEAMIGQIESFKEEWDKTYVQFQAFLEDNTKVSPKPYFGVPTEATDVCRKYIQDGYPEGTIHEPWKDLAHPASPSHLLWMLDEIDHMDGKPTKQHRWLDFVQAAMVIHGWATVDDIANVTRDLLTEW